MLDLLGVQPRELARELASGADAFAFHDWLNAIGLAGREVRDVRRLIAHRSCPICGTSPGDLPITGQDE